MRGRSQQKRIEESIELGRKNVECIKGISGWCKHVRLKQESYGMLAEMTDLPIGLISVSCPHSDGGGSSANLPWIVPEFILRNCIGCKHHSPNGDTKWAERIIEDAKVRAAEQEAQAKARSIQLAELRQSLRKIPALAKAKAPIQEHRILEMLEDLFDSDFKKQSERLKQIIEAASIGSELFSKEIVEFLLNQSLSPEYGHQCLTICAKLAEHRSDFTSRFASMALEAIRQDFYPETAAEVLVAILDETTLPLDRKIPEVLVASQSYYRPIGHNSHGANYPNSTIILSTYYELAPEMVVDVIRERLRKNIKRVRCDVCGVIEALRNLNPKILMGLLPDLLDSLK